MKRWLRQNWVPFLAVVILLPLTIGVTFWNEWRGYFEYNATQATEVERNATAEYAGAEWKITETSRISADTDAGAAAGLPEGTVLVRATVAVTPLELDDEGYSAYCSLRLVELSGAGRSWGDSLYSNIDYRLSDDLEAGCDREQTESYRFEVIFVVPDDVGDDLAITLEVREYLPRYLQLQV